MCRTSLPFAVIVALVAATTATQARQSAQPPAAPATAPASAPAPAPAPQDGGKPAQTSPGAAPADATPAAKRPSAKARVKEVKAVTGTIRTEGHDVRFELFVHKTPTLAANFAFLAKRGFWDGQEWSGFTRVIRQAGPNSIGYPLPREFAPDLTFDDPAGGLLCMTKMSDKVSDAANATRFFVTIKQQDRWNLDFQIFGRVTSGLDTIVNLAEGMKIEKVTVDGDVDALLKAFEVETAQWAELLEKGAASHQLPPGTLPGTPDRRTGQVLPNRPLDGAPAGSGSSGGEK